MYEAILGRHRCKPPSVKQNTDALREPIDGICETGGIAFLDVGDLPRGEGCPLDHSTL